MPDIPGNALSQLSSFPFSIHYSDSVIRDNFVKILCQRPGKMSHNFNSGGRNRQIFMRPRPAWPNRESQAN